VSVVVASMLAIALEAMEYLSLIEYPGYHAAVMIPHETRVPQSGNTIWGPHEFQWQPEPCALT